MLKFSNKFKQSSQELQNGYQGIIFFDDDDDDDEYRHQNGVADNKNVTVVEAFDYKNRDKRYENCNEQDTESNEEGAVIAWFDEESTDYEVVFQR